MSEDCDHAWRYQGLKYQIEREYGTAKKRELTTSRVVEVKVHYVGYFDAYYCTRCMAMHYIRLAMEGNTLDGIRHDATALRVGEMIRDGYNREFFEQLEAQALRTSEIVKRGYK